MKKLWSSLTVVALAGCGQASGPSATTVASLDTAAMIPLTEAISIAAARLPGGFIVSAKLDDEDLGTDPENEPLSYEVAIFTEDTGALWHVGVDVMTGEILEAEIENEETAK